MSGIIKTYACTNTHTDIYRHKLRQTYTQTHRYIYREKKSKYTKETQRESRRGTEGRREVGERQREICFLVKE